MASKTIINLQINDNEFRVWDDQIFSKIYSVYQNRNPDLNNFDIIFQGQKVKPTDTPKSLGMNLSGLYTLTVRT